MSFTHVERREQSHDHSEGAALRVKSLDISWTCVEFITGPPQGQLGVSGTLPETQKSTGSP